MKLIDVCDFIVDCPHTTATDEGVGYPLIRTPNIGRGRLILDGVHRVSKDVYEKRNKRGVPTAGDLILAREAPAGNVAVIQEGQLVCLGQRTVLIRPKKDVVDSNYLAYYLLAPEQQYNLLGSANGATVAHVNMSIIRNLDINLPPIDIQRKIGKIISAYDDLIENNHKQIKLLEEAAQRLYKEWFIDLHFPGHEDCKIVDGVPEGWRQCKLGEVCHINQANISNNYEHGYIDYIDIGSVNSGSIGKATRYQLKDAPGRAKRLAKTGDVIWGMVRPNLKAYALIYEPAKTAVFSTGFAILSADAIPFSYMYELVTRDDFVAYLVNCTNGAAYPAVKPIHFEEADIILPTTSILNEFHKLTKGHYKKIHCLHKMIELAKEARDRLLPKLMSGEIKL